MCTNMLSEEGERRLHGVYRGIKDRCYNPNASSYKYYGARGISVCDLWLSSYAEFHDWAIENGYVEDAPRGECTIDRIDCDGNYEPNNCRWVDMKVQNANRRKPQRVKDADDDGNDDGDENEPVSLRDYIHVYTKKNHTTIEGLASILGVSRTSFYNKISGKTHFLLSEAIELAKELDLSLEELGNIIYP